MAHIGIGKQRYLLLFLWNLSAILLLSNCALATHETITNCTNVKCPPLSEITCPDDSFVREFQESSVITTNEYHEIVEEIFVQCCLTKKCACKLCDIAECEKESDVIYENSPETQIPGQCCGKYECMKEPNCTEVRDTAGKWLTDCQRCECVSGERICHRSCDNEMVPNPTHSLCKSKNLNQFFISGDTWMDGCAECECVNGVEKCMLPFCKHVECPHKKQLKVTLEGHCCPICYPDLTKWQPVTSADDYDYEEEPEDDHNSPSTEEPKLEPEMAIIADVIKDVSTTTPSRPSPLSPLCATVEPPASYSVYTEVVEVVRQSYEISYLYGIIFFLVIALTAIGGMYMRLWSKHRAYLYSDGSVTTKKYSPVPVESTNLKSELI